MSNSSLEKTLSEIRLQVNLGHWGEALSLTKIFVKANPGNLDSRLTLFVLMMMGGDYDRAKKQLVTYFKLGGLNATPDYLVLSDAFQCRESVIKDGLKPNSIGISDDELASWTASLLDLQKGNSNQLKDFNESRLNLSISDVDPSHSSGIFNADFRFRNYLEVVLDGEYTLIGFSEIKELSLPEKPEILVDFLVLPISITLIDGVVKQGFTFSSYPFSYLAEDEKLRFSRTTDWNADFDDVDIGLGGQIFGQGDKFRSIFQLGTVQFDNLL